MGPAMLRQTSSRNSRSKGLKVKSALQICLLFIVAVWLLYQVKHSYDKKTYDGTDPQRQNDGTNLQDVFGRRGLPQRFKADSSTLDERLEDEENDEIELEMRPDDNDNDNDDAVDEQDFERDDDNGLELGGETSSKKEGGEDELSDDVGAAVESEEDKHPDKEALEGRGFSGESLSSEAASDSTNEKEEALRKAREKSFNGDNASSAVAHDGAVEERSTEETHDIQVASSAVNGTSNDPQVITGVASANDSSWNSNFNRPTVNGTVAANITSKKTELEGNSSSNNQTPQLVKQPFVQNEGTNTNHGNSDAEKVGIKMVRGDEESDASTDKLSSQSDARNDTTGGEEVMLE